jgi:hypothetical protein
MTGKKSENKDSLSQEVLKSFPLAFGNTQYNIFVYSHPHGTAHQNLLLSNSNLILMDKPWLFHPSPLPSPLYGNHYSVLNSIHSII